MRLFFFLHTFESHVIYGLHFHAYMKHVVPLPAVTASATTSKLLYPFSACLLCYATLPKCLLVYAYICIQFQMRIILLPLNCCINVTIWIVDACAHNEFWGGNSLTLPLANHEWKKSMNLEKERVKEIYKPTLNWKIVSKTLNNWEFSTEKGTGNAHTAHNKESEGGDRARQRATKAQRAGIFDFLQMSNDHYRNKFQKETTETMLYEGEKLSIHVVVDASTFNTNCSPASNKDKTVTITSYSLAYLIWFFFLFFFFLFIRCL